MVQCHENADVCCLVLMTYYSRSCGLKEDSPQGPLPHLKIPSLLNPFLEIKIKIGAGQKCGPSAKAWINEAPGLLLPSTGHTL
jgi:hypothetical protein